MTKIGSFFGHEAQGAKVAETILRRMRLPESLVSDVSTMIAEHLRPPMDPSDKALRNYVADLGPLWEDALYMKAGDLSAHNLPPGFDTHAWLEKIRARINAIPKELTGFDQTKLALSGTEIVKRFGVVGKQVGAFKKCAAQAVVDGTIPNEAEAIANFLASEKDAGRI